MSPHVVMGKACSKRKPRKGKWEVSISASRARIRTCTPCSFHIDPLCGFSLPYLVLTCRPNKLVLFFVVSFRHKNGDPQITGDSINDTFIDYTSCTIFRVNCIPRPAKGTRIQEMEKKKKWSPTGRVLNFNFHSGKADPLPRDPSKRAKNSMHRSVSEARVTVISLQSS